MENKIYYVSDIKNILGCEKINFHLMEVIKINAAEVEKKRKLLDILSDSVNWFYEHKKAENTASPSDWLTEANAYFSKHIHPWIEEHKKGEFEGHYWVPANKYEIGQVFDEIPPDCTSTFIDNFEKIR